MLSVDSFFDNNFINKDDVFILDHDDQYAENFGKQWKKYLYTQIDSKNNFKISHNYISELLFNDFKYITDKKIFEIGSGAGRFTEILSKYSKEIYTIDLSKSIFYNVEKNNPNVCRIKGNFFNLKPKGKFDVIICRGVLQHTPYPMIYLQKLFEFCKDNGVVIFDIYSLPKLGKLHPKYFFWRPLFKKFVKYENFEIFLNKNIKKLLKIKRFLKTIFFKSNFISDSIIPIYDYNGKIDLNESQLEEWAILDTLDGMYAVYDFPQKNSKIVNFLKSNNKTILKNNKNKNYFIVKNS